MPKTITINIICNGCYCFPALISFFLLLSSFQLLAQPDPGVFKRIPGDSYGIPELDVHDIIQDQDGFFWIATLKGLIRYDGREMLIYRENPANPKGLGDNRVKHLVEDKEGYLWIGTANEGLSHYDRHKDIFTHFLHDPTDTASLFNNEIRDLLIDSQGRLWVATRINVDLYDHRKKVFIHYQYHQGDSLSHNDLEINCLREDRFGNIWIGTEKSGLYYLNPDENKIKQASLAAEGIIPNKILRIVQGPDGYLWFSSNELRLYRIDPASFQIQAYPLYLDDDKNLNASYVKEIWPDRDGTFWLGTNSRGLIHYSIASGVAKAYRHDPGSRSSIGSDHITSLWLDHSGYLWMGHRGPGLSFLSTNRSGFDILPIRFIRNGGVPYPSYQSLMEDNFGNIWAGTWRNGLYRYDQNTKKTTAFQHREDNPEGLADNMVWDVLEDRNGFIWIATHKGLQCLDPEKDTTFTTFGLESGLRTLPVRSLLEDRSGRLWIGTFGGLHWLDSNTGKIHFVTSFPNHTSFLITELFEDSHNNLWVAVLDQGVYRLNLKTNNWIHFKKKRNDPKGLTSNIVWRIVEDARNRIWLGTAGGGLNLFVPHPTIPDSSFFRHWRPYNSALPDENIFNLSTDGEQGLWLSTDMGLFSFDTETRQIKPYSLPGRIKGLNVRTRSGSQGMLYVGNAENMYRFHPDSIWQNKHEPPVFITVLQIKGRQVPVQNTFGDSLSQPSPLKESILYTSSIELKYWQNDLTFVFTALNYIRPENNQYRYKLDGDDEDWIYTDASRRYIRYTNLKPGKYNFQVIASNNEDLWNTTGKTISLRIHPPWWYTPWAYVLWAVLLIGIIFEFYRFQLNRRLARAEHQRLQELDAFKTRFYTNITHEFRTPLTIILGMAEQLKNQVSEHAKDGLKLIHRNGQQLFKLVNQMLDLSKLESGHLKLEKKQDDIINYLQYLLESFHSLAASKNIRLHFLNDLKEYYMDYDPTRLMHIISNLLTNAIKFTPEEGNVYLSVEELKASRQLQIKVKDTGIGIPEKKLPFIFNRFYQVDDSATRKGKGTGIGLTLTRELVKLMGGEINAASELGKGSEFTIILPITQQHEIKPEEPEGTIIHKAEDFAKPSVARQKGNLESPMILIVEDNPDLVKYLMSSFKGAYQIEVGYNGNEGIEKAISLIPDIIITDVMMPGKDGFELCRVLKAHELTSHIPIIMLTAKADIESRLAGLKQGADAYLAKPFVRQELQIRVEALLEQREKLQKYYRTQAEMFDRLSESTPSIGEKTEDIFVQKVREIIELHFHDHLFSVAQLCNELGISQAQLYRKMTALTGKSANHFIRSFRINKAKTLLKETTLNIAEIAYDLGFKDPDYFSKVFKAETGTSPSAFRLADE